MSDESVDDQQTPEGDYDGETLNGLRHGQGTYIFPSGARYIGNWNRGLKHGVGTFIYPDGSRYEGQWWQNQKHGYGKYFYPNGDVYNGMWRLNSREGYGHYWDEERKFHFQGYFCDGNLTGPVRVLMVNVQFEGNFVNGKPVGKGTYYLPNGMRVNGEFRLYSEKTPLWTTTKVERSYLSNEDVDIY